MGGIYHMSGSGSKLSEITASDLGIITLQDLSVMLGADLSEILYGLGILFDEYGILCGSFTEEEIGNMTLENFLRELKEGRLGGFQRVIEGITLPNMDYVSPIEEHPFERFFARPVYHERLHSRKNINKQRIYYHGWK